MPIPSDQVSVLEQNINRLASEAVMASAGRDEGLVPAYSLLGDIADICALDDVLRPVVSSVRNRLEEKLDRAEPFDAPTLGELRQVAEWLANNCDALRSGNSMSPWPKAVASTGASASAPAAPSAEAAAPLTADQAAAAASAATESAHGEEVLMVLNLEENRDLLVEFYGETAEHLQQIESTLLRLEEHPEDPEALSALFRSFHTIKGNAGFLQLLPMHTLAHEVESLLDLARNRKLTLNSTIITEILRSRDALQALAQQVSCALETGQLPKEIVPVGPLIVAVMRLASGASEAAAAPAPAVQPAVSPTQSGHDGRFLYLARRGVRSGRSRDPGGKLAGRRAARGRCCRRGAGHGPGADCAGGFGPRASRLGDRPRQHRETRLADGSRRRTRDRAQPDHRERARARRRQLAASPQCRST